MRQVGSLSSEGDARRFAAYLLQQDIDALVEHDNERWVVWVRNEDQRGDARTAMQHFLANPRDPRYQQAERTVEFKRHESVRPATPRRRLTWSRPFRDPNNRPDVILALIIISIAVTLGSWMLPRGSIGDSLKRVLQYADLRDPLAAQDAFCSIKQGELWRLITPIFLHFTWDHLLLDMFMFYYLGAQIERLRGPVALGLLVLLLASVSNSAQAHFGGAGFGGMSGVVYGLLGYIWIKTSYEPESGFRLDPLVLILLLAWFFLCLFMMSDTIANYAHLGGLIAGMVIALAPSRRDEPPSEGMI